MCGRSSQVVGHQSVRQARSWQTVCESLPASDSDRLCGTPGLSHTPKRPRMRCHRRDSPCSHPPGCHQSGTVCHPLLCKTQTTHLPTLPCPHHRAAVRKAALYRSGRWSRNRHTGSLHREKTVDGCPDKPGIWPAPPDQPVRRRKTPAAIPRHRACHPSPARRFEAPPDGSEIDLSLSSPPHLHLQPSPVHPMAVSIS